MSLLTDGSSSMVNAREGLIAQLKGFDWGIQNKPGDQPASLDRKTIEWTST